jgi:hypothetical protein
MARGPDSLVDESAMLIKTSDQKAHDGLWLVEQQAPAIGHMRVTLE